MNTTDLQKQIDSLSKPTEVLLEEYKERAPRTFPDEIALKHPSEEIGVHLRDDGSLELYAGKARIILDGDSGSIMLLGNHLISSTIDANIDVSANASFGISSSPLNPAWMDFFNIIKNPNSLSPLTYSPLGKTMTFLTGKPANNSQKAVSFTKVMEEKPLFLPPTSTSIFTGLKQILEEYYK
jgi:hypothetical protein